MGPLSAIGLGMFIIAAAARIEKSDFWAVYYAMGLAACLVDFLLSLKR